jgi:O-antigen/teichoic acid export membrane protein
MGSLQKRVVANGAAAVYGMVVVALGQILMVPLFLTHWGAHVYGEWLAISAVPAYFAMSDFGLGPVAGNRVAMLAASGNLAGARATLNTIWCIQTTVALAVMAISAGAVYSLPLDKWLGVEAIPGTDLQLALLLLTAYVMSNMLAGVFVAVYRSAAKNARGVFVLNTVRLSEVLAGIVVLFVGGGVVEFAGAMLAIRLLGLAVLWIDALRQAPGLAMGWRDFSAAELRVLAGPATGHIGLALGSMLQLQGFLLLVNQFLGPLAVVQFSLLRTATRFCVQLVLIINNAVYPEFSALLATKSFERARELYRLAVQSSAWLSGVYGVTLLVLASWIIPLWSAGQVRNDGWLLLLLCVAVILNCVWSTSSLVQSSSNNHARLGMVYAVLAGAGLWLAWWLAPRFGLRGVAAALALVDAAVLAYTYLGSCALMHDQPGAVFKDALQLGAIRRRLRMLRNAPTAT